MVETLHNRAKPTPNPALVGPPLPLGISNPKRREGVEEVFRALGVEGRGFLPWLVTHFASADRSVGCGDCCRGRVPSLVRYCESEYRKDFVSMVEGALVFIENPQDKAFLFANLEHYFAHPTGFDVRKAQSAYWQRLKDLF